MRPSLLLLWIGLWLANVSAYAQGYPDELNETLVENSLVEEMMDEKGPSTIVLDITRTKIGRDFYESFYQQWGNLPQILPVDSVGDSTGTNSKPATVFNMSEFVIMIEELPSATNALANLISISVDNELLWQQFVPARREIIDDYALYAVDVVRAYFVEIQTVNTQLGAEDQQGTGIN